MSSFLNENNSIHYYNSKKYNFSSPNYPDNGIDLIKEYNSNLGKIKELNTKLINYDSKINEITELNIKVNHLKKLIKSKNETISNYEQLSNISKEKLIYLKRKKNINIQDENNNNKLLKSNEMLSKIYIELKEQNNYYKKQINLQSKSDLFKINNIRNELTEIKSKVNK